MSAHRVVVGTDSGATVRVTGITRGFLLSTDYRPEASFLGWGGDAVLTLSTPSAVLWRR